MKSDSFSNLVQAYLDGSIAATELEELNELLGKDRESRVEFGEWLGLDSALDEWAKGEEVATSSVVEFPRRESTGISLRKTSAIAAAIIGTLLVVGLWSAATRFDSPEFATVTKGAGVPELADGMVLDGSTYFLSVGAAELETPLGAKIVVEAPAEFRFESSQRMHLKSGRLSADVPPSATGFTVVTPTGDAIDLGTRFGVDVSDQGDAEIHVFEGEVIARHRKDDSTPKNNGKGLSLRGGEAWAMGSLESDGRSLRSGAFIHHDEIPSLSAGLQAGQRDRAENALEVLRNDEALIRVLDFEDNSSIPKGTYRLVQGRWPGSQAPEFIDAGDHMKLLLTEESQTFPQVTVATWVRLDRLGAPYQSLIHVDGWNEGVAGKFHWMIIADSTMRLALSGNRLAPAPGVSSQFPDSRTPVLPERGRWVHLAATYDSEAGMVRFYYNGKFDNEASLSTAHPARFGSARIGNWNRKDRKLSGRIDEFVLLSRVMSDSEIAELFEAGNPYR